jgi:hypothetical protein
MRTIDRPAPIGVRPRLSEARELEPAYQAYSIMYLGYIALPIIAGLDKFAHLLVNWNVYVSPLVARLVGGRVTAFMDVVGVIEVVAGLLVAIKPRLGAPIVGLWLLGIIVNLLLIPGSYDIALRDFGLSLGAFSLWRLSYQYGERASERSEIAR